MQVESIERQTYSSPPDRRPSMVKQLYLELDVLPKMNSMNNLIFLFVVFFLFSSCNKDLNEVNIDSDILISTEKNDQNVLLNASTEKHYPTLGYQIRYREQVKDKEIKIEFIEVIAPEVGLTALGPARCSINLGDLEHGAYDITFELNQVETKGKLIVGTTAELTIESGGNVKPQ